MNRKAYIKPSIYSKKVVCNQLLAGSLDQSSDDSGSQVNSKPLFGNGFNWSPLSSEEGTEEPGE